MKTTVLNGIRIAVLLAVFSSLTLGSGLAMSGQDPSSQQIRTINIPAGPLKTSLVELGEQLGVDIFASSELVGEKTAPSISGKYSPEDALKKALSNSGLTFMRANKGGFLIEKLPLDSNQASALIKGQGDEYRLKANSTRPETIVVYGERIERRLEETLSSVSVISNAEVGRRAQKTLYEALIGVPNLVVNEGDSLAAIRGQEVNANGASLGNAILSGAEPRSVLILDDFARAPAWANIAYSSLFDVEQIEVFRGPQSTLRGRNAIAGAYVVRTKDAEFEYSSRVLAEYANIESSGSSSRLAGAFGGPLLKDYVAGRIIVDIRNDEDPISGFGAPGAYMGSASLNDARSIETQRIGGKLRYQPTRSDDFRIDLQANYVDGITPLYRNRIAGPSQGFDWEDRIYGFPNDFRVVDAVSEFLGAKVSLNTQEFGSFEFLTSWSEDRLETNQERNSSGVNFLEGSADELATLELLWRFGDGKGPLSGLIGASYNDRKNLLDAIAFGTVPVVAENDTVTKAVYADIRYQARDNLEFNFGGRFLKTEQMRNFEFFLPIVVDEKYEDSVFLPQFGVLYNLDDNQTIGLSIRRGYGDGGRAPNNQLFTTFEFDPEFVWTYEGSYKTNMLEGRARIAATVFYNDYKDYQASLEIATTPPSFEIVNQPEARSYGIELEGAYDYSQSLSITAGLGLLETEITKQNQNLTIPIEGNDFGKDPGYTVSLGLVWTPTYDIEVDGRLNRVDEYFNAIGNDENSIGGSYTLVDLGISYDFGLARARIFIQNAFDEVAFISKDELSGLLADPRTIGLTVTADFD